MSARGDTGKEVTRERHRRAVRPEKPRDFARLALVVIGFVLEATAWFAASFAVISYLGW